jgi:ubiquinol-cytochrome c reductase cytochrome b subunit
MSDVKNQELNSFVAWVDKRFPLLSTWQQHLSEYMAPKNFNFWYYFGSFAMLVLVIQLVSGVWLTMSYKPGSAIAFDSIQYIMRDVEWGWMIRYMHSTGASFFFLVVYLHMLRGLMYGSYRAPRELLWILGCTIYLVMMAEAFMGYLLPWGQMSFWGAQVIISLFSAVPLVGEELAVWIRGDFVISDATLNRFFALHVVALPLALVALVYVHIVALHKVGSNNPDGIEIKENKDADGKPVDGIPFHPYYTVKDLMGATAFLIVFCAVMFFAPEMFGYFLEKPNFEPANPLKTPEHIAPVWYFTPYYAMLRAVPDKLLGAIIMFAAILIFYFLPWLNRSKNKSIRYMGWMSKLSLAVFIITFIILGWLGTQPASGGYVLAAQIFTAIYFLYFLLMPWYSKWDKAKELPTRLT